MMPRERILCNFMILFRKCCKLKPSILISEIFYLKRQGQATIQTKMEISSFLTFLKGEQVFQKANKKLFLITNYSILEYFFKLVSLHLSGNTTPFKQQTKIRQI